MIFRHVCALKHLQEVSVVHHPKLKVCITTQNPFLCLLKTFSKKKESCDPISQRRSVSGLPVSVCFPLPPPTPPPPPPPAQVYQCCCSALHFLVLTRLTCCPLVGSIASTGHLA